MLDRYRKRDHQLAELLVCTGFLRPVDHDKASACCRDERTKLCEVLLKKKLVKPDILLSAIEILHEIEEGRLTLPDGRKALYLVGNYKLTVEEAMTKLGLGQARNPWQVQIDAKQMVQEHLTEQIPATEQSI